MLPSFRNSPAFRIKMAAREQKYICKFYGYFDKIHMDNMDN